MEGKSSSLAAVAELATRDDSEEIPSSSSNLEEYKANNPPIPSIHVKFADDSKPPRDSKDTLELSPQSSKREESLDNKPKRKKTTLLEHSPVEYAFVVGLGMLMSFIAGYSNAVCLSGNIQRIPPYVQRSVAGVTGAYTGSAIDILQGNWERYRLNVGTILSVCGGACIASLFNPYPIPFQLCPRFGITFLIGGFFTTLGAVSDIHNGGREYFFTATGNGIMNGIASMYTANLIRTTHLTGITTDIGLFVGQVLCGNRMNLWRLYILAGLAFSFFLGSLGGYAASVVEREYALIMNACFFYGFGISIIVYNFKSHDEMNWCDAIFGVGFCSSSNHYDENPHHEYDTGCIDTNRGIFRLCGSGVWCCKRSDEETHRVSVLIGSEPNSTNDADPEGNNNDDDHHAAAETASGRHKRRFATPASDCTRISKKELMEIFDTIDDDGDNRVCIEEFVLEVLHVERLWGELEKQHPHEEESRISASRRSECIAHSHEFRDHSHRSSSRTHNNNSITASMKSHAMNSIDTLRIASIREIESTGHHVG